jgi:hypothetical protein
MSDRLSLQDACKVLVDIRQDRDGNLIFGIEPEFLARVITEAQAYDLCGFSQRTWDRLRAAGDLPKFTRLSSKRYGIRLIDLIRWLDQRRYTPTIVRHTRFGRPPETVEAAAAAKPKRSCGSHADPQISEGETSRAAE